MAWGAGPFISGSIQWGAGGLPPHAALLVRSVGSTITGWRPGAGWFPIGTLSPALRTLGAAYDPVNLKWIFAGEGFGGVRIWDEVAGTFLAPAAAVPAIPGGVSYESGRWVLTDGQVPGFQTVYVSTDQGASWAANLVAYPSGGLGASPAVGDGAGGLAIQFTYLRSLPPASAPNRQFGGVLYSTDYFATTLVADYTTTLYAFYNSQASGALRVPGAGHWLTQGGDVDNASTTAPTAPQDTPAVGRGNPGGWVTQTLEPFAVTTSDFARKMATDGLRVSAGAGGAFGFSLGAWSSLDGGLSWTLSGGEPLGLRSTAWSPTLAEFVALSVSGANWDVVSSPNPSGFGTFDGGSGAFVSAGISNRLFAR